MTDEERRKLCKELRLHMEYYGMEFCKEAADEIERLTEENRKLKGSLNYAWLRIEAETGAKE